MNSSSPRTSSHTPCGETWVTSTAEVLVPCGDKLIAVLLNDLLA
jgi:hypothetical protein